MGASLRPTEIHKRRHRKAKRIKLRRQLATAPSAERPALEAKLQRTYELVPDATPPAPK